MGQIKQEDVINHKGVEITNIYVKESKWIIDNPTGKYNDLTKAVKKSKLKSAYFSVIKRRLLGETGSSKPKFKKSLMSIIAQIDKPDTKDSEQTLNWVANTFIKSINDNQSAFKFTLGQEFGSDKIEIRMHTSK